MIWSRIWPQRVSRVWHEWLWVGVLLASIVLLVTHVYADGFPYTHDGENHLARFMNTAAAIREGQWPPRFAPYVLSGFGFPVLHYNYPLANLLAAPFIWLGFHPSVPFVWIVRTAWWTSGLAWYGLLRRRHRVAALVASISWLSSSYFVTSIAYRGNIGEALALAGFPIVLWFWYRWSVAGTRSRWWLAGATLSTALWLLAHNVLIVLLVPWVGWWSLIQAWRRARLRAWFVGWVLAVGLVMWFWLPAVFELSLIVLQSDSLANQAAEHTLTWSQIWWQPWRFGFSRSGALDSLGLSLGVGSLLVVVSSVSVMVHQIWHEALVVRWFRQSWRRIPQEGVVGLGVLVRLAGSIFLASSASIGVWTAVPALSILQFPWRWLALTSVMLPVVLWWVWPRLIGPLRCLIAALIIVQVGWAFQVKPADRISYPASYYRQFPASTTTRNENRPTTLVFEPYNWGDWTPNPRIVSGEATVNVQRWNGSFRRYQVTAQTDIVIQEPTVYFPGWQVRVDGQPQPVVFEDETFGLIAYRLAARPDQPYQVVTRFAETTVWRRLGDSITVLSLIIGLSWWTGFTGILQTRLRKWQKG